MHRIHIFLLLVTLTSVCIAQTSTNANTSGTYINPLTGAGGANISFGANYSKSLFGLNIIEYGRGQANSGNSDIEGSIYLFKSWNNLSRIWFEDKIFDLESVNYNLRHQRFEIRLKNDSILIVNPATAQVKQVLINNRVLKPYYNKELSRDTFFEVLWNSDEYSLLSNYKLRINPGAQDPMTKTYTSSKKYSQTSNYYIKKNNEEQMTSIKLKKSEILKLIDDSNLDDVKRFVKKRNLKYNRIPDVKDILTYYNSIKN